MWIAPVQAQVIPIADRHRDAASEAVTALRERGLRVELDDRREKVGLKIRQAELRRIPFMAVIGDREVDAGAVAVRTRGRRGQRILSVATFGDEMERLVADRSLAP